MALAPHIGAECPPHCGIAFDVCGLSPFQARLISPLRERSAFGSARAACRPPQAARVSAALGRADCSPRRAAIGATRRRLDRRVRSREEPRPARASFDRTEGDAGMGPAPPEPTRGPQWLRSPSPPLRPVPLKPARYTCSSARSHLPPAPRVSPPSPRPLPSSQSTTLASAVPPRTSSSASPKVLKPNLKDQALEIHLQRIVGSFVASACGAGNFYSAKVGTARDLTSKLANDTRDEDRDPVYGFESRAQRARFFAAEMGLQAFALLAAAKGAVEAFADATGSEWKPYVPDQTTTPGLTRRAAEAELAAFDAT